MSKFLYILDAGHGGLNESGEYVTSGKRSPEFDDGRILYEGVENRRKVAAIKYQMDKHNLDSVILCPGYHDFSLSSRVRKANQLNQTRPCIYISIHSDAYGVGWTNPSGIGVYHFQGSKQSKKIAKLFRQELTCNFDGIALDRKIKEARFYVLHHTAMPAVLLELGFHSNKEESKRMMSDEWIDLVAKSVVDSCELIETMKP
jgi:N-acetylmuramoyl-L-alanine amidase